MTDRTHPDSGIPFTYGNYVNYAEHVQSLQNRIKNLEQEVAHTDSLLGKANALARIRAHHIAELEAQLEAIGAGGVSGPLVGRTDGKERAGRFTKKPVTIDAWLIDFGNKPLPDWVHEAFRTKAIDWCPAGEWLYINTLEGHMLGANGSWLIKGVKGELYACKPDIFAATYERASLAASELPEGITRDDTVHGETYFTAADMATAEARGFRDGVASAAASAGNEPEAPSGWREAIGEIRAGLEDSEPSGYDNSGYRAFAGTVLDAVEDALTDLITHPSPPEGMVAEQALRKVLSVVQRYLPPDGPSAHDAMSEITAIVDPWPLGPLEKS